MADNIKWILDHNQGAKIVLWAYNGHISTAGEGGFDPMGAALRKMFGDQMVVFGFAFNQGSFQAMEMPFPSKRGLRTFNVDPAPEGSLDAMLASAGLQIAAIDLRTLPKKGEVANWFSEPRATRSIGAGYGEQFAANFLAKQVTPKIYDALLFVEKTTAARPLGKGTSANTAWTTVVTQRVTFRGSSAVAVLFVPEIAYIFRYGYGVRVGSRERRIKPPETRGVIC